MHAVDNSASVLTSELLVFFLALYTFTHSSVEAAPVPYKRSAPCSPRSGREGSLPFPGTPNVQKCYGPGLPVRTQPLRDTFVVVLPPAGFFGVCTEHPQNTTATHLSSEATPPGLSVSEQGAHAQCHPCQGCLRCGEILGRVPAKFPWRSPRTLKIPEPGHVTGRDCV